MKANEIMIGDWVKFDEDICSVDEVRLDGAVVLTSMNTDLTSVDGSQVEDEEIEPIPLTEGILEKNGFVKDKTQYGEDFYEFWSEDLEYCIYLYLYGVYFFLFDNINMQIKYVHELQHILRLCNIDKEIEI